MGNRPFTTIAAVLFAIYYLNWAYGWVTPNDLDIYDRIF